jgi:hypothetical protein
MKPLIIVLSVVMLAGCSRYFKPVNVNAPSRESITRLIDSNKIFIVHDYSRVYELKNPRLNEDGTSLTGNLATKKGIRLSQGSKNKIYYRYKHVKSDSVITNQVHLYASQKLTASPGIVTSIPLHAISRVESVQFDKRKTTRAHVGTAVGIVAGVGLTIATLGAAAAASFAFGL